MTVKILMTPWCVFLQNFVVLLSRYFIDKYSCINYTDSYSFFYQLLVFTKDP